MSITKDKAISAVRTRARELGMVYRVQKARIDGVQAYELANRNDNELLKSDLTAFGAYEAMLNGDLERIAADAGCESEKDREYRLMVEGKDRAQARMAACIKTVIRDETIHAYDWHEPDGLPCKDLITGRSAARLKKSHKIDIVNQPFYRDLFKATLEEVYYEQEKVLVS